MFPRSGAVVTTGSGSTGASTGTSGSTTPTTTGTSDATIQGWIRGNGLFRSVLNAFGPTEDFTDTHWQNLVFTPYLMGGDVTLNIYKPSATLAGQIVPYTSPGLLADAVPAGTWTWIVNTNNTSTVNIKFAEVCTVTGRDASGTYITGGINSSFTLGQGRMALLVYYNVNKYYLRIF